jgi:hypothetical protein
MHSTRFCVATVTVIPPKQKKKVREEAAFFPFSWWKCVSRDQRRSMYVLSFSLTFGKISPLFVKDEEKGGKKNGTAHHHHNRFASADTVLLVCRAA